MINRLTTTGLTTLALMLGLCGARADDLINHLEYMRQHNRGIRGEYVLGKITDLKTDKRRRRTGKLHILKRMGNKVQPEKVEVVQLSYLPRNDIPQNKPLLVVLWNINNQQRLQGMYRASGRGSAYYLDRGGPDSQFFKLTDELLFGRPKAEQLPELFDRLLALTEHKEARISDLASHYLGSKLSPYNRENTTDEMVNKLTDKVLACKNALVLSHLVSFYRNVRLPAEPERVMALLKSDNPVILGPVTYQVKRSTERAEAWHSAFHRALVRPDSEKLRQTVLDCLLAWGSSAADHWDTLEALALGRPDLEVGDHDQAVAAQVLVRIDPARASRTVEKALPELDSPAIYRFVYEQKMYHTVGVLIDKLRNNNTTQAKIVMALLGSLTRKVDMQDEKAWLQWWDDLGRRGTREQLVKNNFVPIGDLSARIDRLVKQLGSRDFETRQAAVAALHQIGPVANPRLEQAQAHSDFEVAESARQLLKENQRRLAPVVAALYGRTVKTPGRGSRSEIQKKLLIERAAKGF